METPDLTELEIRADAATKLAMVSIEFQMNLAKHFGLNLDLDGAAASLMATEVLDSADARLFKIEKGSRERAAAILRHMARSAI